VEEKTMILSNRALGVPARLMMICAVFVILLAMAVKAEAIPFTTIATEHPYGDSTLTLEVSAKPVEGSDAWIFNYDVQNPGRNIWWISVGLIDPGSLENYTAVVTAPPMSGSVTYPTTSAGDSSVILFFGPYPGLLLAGLNYEFQITYDSFISSQNITFSGSSPATITPSYELPRPIPEPATMLLLVSGIIGLGLLSRKRWRA